MLNILMINLPFSGHVNPTLPLAERLVERGHKVDYICTKQFKEKIERTGAKFIRYVSFPDDPTENEKKKLSFEAAFQTAVGLKDKYDILIYEMFFYPGIRVAEILGIPCVRQFSQPAWSDESWKNMSRIFKISSKLIDAQVMGKKRIKAMGLPFSSMDDAIRHSRPNLNIVYIPEDFQACRSSFDETFTFIIPEQKPIIGTVKIPYEKLKHPVVYISFGSIISDRSFYKKCIRLFGNKDLSIILNTGKVDPKSLGAMPENIYAYSYVPQVEVLQHTDVFVTHCGMNSVNESIAAGVPMVAMPFINDQVENGKQIDKLKIGKRIRSFPSSSSELESAIYELLNNTEYRENVRKMRDSIGKADSWESILSRIESLVL